MTNQDYNAPNELKLIQIAPQPEVREFKLDAGNFSVEIDVSTNPERVKILEALLVKPDPKTYRDLLIRREAMTSTEYVDENATQERIRVSGTGANAKLFDEIGKKIKGVRFPGEDAKLAGELRDITPEISEALFSTWKSDFINGMYRISAKLREVEDEKFVVLGGSDVMTVDLTIGDEDNPIVVLTFDLPQPGESERDQYQENVVKLLQPKGAKKSSTKIVTDLGRVIKFFDLLMDRDGSDVRIEQPDLKATVKGKTFSETAPKSLERKLFIDAIDPIYKRTIISAMMTRYQSKVQD